jgi:peptide/nickel transport system substrate-binding protein
MDKHFSVKDLVLLLLLVAVITMIGLCMLQYDRQWEVINQVNTRVSDQTRDLAAIRRLLEQGAVSVNSSTPTANPNLGFERVLATHSSPDYAPGDAIVDTMSAVPAKLTSLIALDLPAYQVQGYVLESLCDRDPDTLKWIPRLATSWEISSDQLSITFQLRRGVTFSDGQPMTADDVIYTMDLERNPAIEAPRINAYLDKLDRVEKTGDYSVRFVFKEPYFKSFEVAATTQVLSRAFYSQFSPKDFNESTGLLFGSGPYQLADSKAWRPEPGKPIELVRNQRYWGVAPAADRMIWKVIANASARVTAFRNGETDLYAPTPEQYDQLCKDPALASRTRHFAIDTPTSGYRYLGWNEVINGKPSWFADKRVRQAMTLLIDREAIVKDIMHGYAKVNSSMFSELTAQADPSVQPMPFDPQRAAQLLAEAGYVKKNGTLVDADGKPFEFKLSYGSVNPVAVQIASFVKDALAPAGVIVDLAPTETAVMFEQMKEKKFQAVIGGWSGVLEQDPHQIFCTSAISGTGDNFISYSNPKLDVLTEQARSTVSEEQRMPLWHQVHRIIAEDQPYTFLFIIKSLSFVDGRFKGILPTKLGLNPNLEWYVPLDKQKYRQ